MSASGGRSADLKSFLIEFDQKTADANFKLLAGPDQCISDRRFVRIGR